MSKDFCLTFTRRDDLRLQDRPNVSWLMAPSRGHLKQLALQYRTCVRMESSYSFSVSALVLFLTWCTY